MTPRRYCTFDGLLAGLCLVAAAGCAPGDNAPLDSLPWSQASVVETAPADEQRFEVQTTAPPESMELEFRERIVQAYLPELRRIAAEPLLVESVAQANESGWQSQQQIAQTDLRWRTTQGASDPLVQKYLMNPCADLLRGKQQNDPAYLELFVMDNRGCIVAESDKTSDYWQGDEPKWNECYNDGNGKVYVGDVDYDQSTRSYVVQMSLPVHDGRGATIGVMTASITSGNRN
jgi:hypothetical protein